MKLRWSFVVELAGLYSNPLKKISAFRKSLLNQVFTNVRGDKSSSSDKDSIAHFCEKGKYGDLEVQRYKQKQKILSQQERMEVVEKYQSGATTYELAEQYGCHRNTISNTRKKAGIKVTLEKLNLDEAIKLYESGWTTKQIADKYQMSDNSVSRRLKIAGVKMRTRWDYPK